MKEKTITWRRVANRDHYESDAGTVKRVGGMWYAYDTSGSEIGHAATKERAMEWAQESYRSRR